MNTLSNLSSTDLRRAADIQEQIQHLQAELEQVLSGKKKPGRKPGRKPGALKPGPKPGRRKPGPKPGAKKKKATRNMSPEGRAAISAAAKRRWAKKKREDKAAAKKK